MASEITSSFSKYPKFLAVVSFLFLPRSSVLYSVWSPLCFILGKKICLPGTKPSGATVKDAFKATPYKVGRPVGFSVTQCLHSFLNTLERHRQAADGQHISGVRGKLRQRERHVCLQEVGPDVASSRRRTSRWEWQ